MASRLTAKLKTAFGIIVIVGVAWHFAKILAGSSSSLTFNSTRWYYLLPAALLYLANHLIWGTYWWQLLRYEQQQITWPHALRVYFASQLGKYVPGKAWVVVMRVAMLRKTSRVTVAITAVIETLISMAAGVVLAAATLAVSKMSVSPQIDRSQIFPLIAASPVIAALTLWVVRRSLNARNSARSKSIAVPSVSLLLRGMAQAVIGWCCLAVSLNLVIAAVRPDLAQHHWLSLQSLAAVSTAYVAGFVILVAPGGLGVREWVLAMILAANYDGQISNADAVAIALLLRLTWTAAEVVVAGSIWLHLQRMNRVHDN